MSDSFSILPIPRVCRHRNRGRLIEIQVNWEGGKEPLLSKISSSEGKGTYHGYARVSRPVQSAVLEIGSASRTYGWARGGFGFRLSPRFLEPVGLQHALWGTTDGKKLDGVFPHGGIKLHVSA